MCVVIRIVCSNLCTCVVKWALRPARVCVACFCVVMFVVIFFFSVMGVEMCVATCVVL